MEHLGIIKHISMGCFQCLPHLAVQPHLLVVFLGTSRHVFLAALRIYSVECLLRGR